MRRVGISYEEILEWSSENDKKKIKENGILKNG